MSSIIDVLENSIELQNKFNELSANSLYNLKYTVNHYVDFGDWIEVTVRSGDNDVVSWFKISLMPGSEFSIIFHDVAVHPNFRNKGIGSFLLNLRLALIDHYDDVLSKRLYLSRFVRKKGGRFKILSVIAIVDAKNKQEEHILTKAKFKKSKLSSRQNIFTLS